MLKITGYIDRAAQKWVEKWLAEGYITVILGARQTGKTTLIKKLQGKLKGKSFYYLLDSALTSAKIESDPEFLQNDLAMRLGTSIEKFAGEINIFLDEVQKAPSVFEQVKLWHDTYKNKFHIVLSGSASLDIQKKCSESLAGRAQYVYLYPLTIHEIVKNMFQQDTQSFLSNLDQVNFHDLQQSYASFYPQKQELNLLFKNLMVFGLLPGVMTRQENEKFAYLRSIIELYLDKDIRATGMVKELSDFNKLLEIASYEVGGLINIQNLSRVVNSTAVTLNNHLSILENTFVINFLEPFVAVRDRAVKSKKWYFYDVGVPNYLARRLKFENVYGAKVYGGIWENILLTSALSIFKNEVASRNTFFWRNYEGREIDLVLEKGNEIIPVEITASAVVEKRKIDNLKFFLEKNAGVKQAFVVYGGDLKEIKISGTHVIFLPWVLWG